MSTTPAINCWKILRIIVVSEVKLLLTAMRSKNFIVTPTGRIVQVAKQHRLALKVMLCVQCNFKGIIHFELVLNGAVNVALNGEQMNRV